MERKDFMKWAKPFICIFLLLYILPLNAYAYSEHSGLFIASDYSEAYHVLFCRDASKIGNHRTYYNSTRTAEADGKRPCMHCGKYIRIIRGDYTGTATERNIIDAYLEGFYAGESSGNIAGFKEGEDYGYDQGYDDAENFYREEIESLNDSHRKEINEIKSKIPWGWILTTAAIAFLVHIHLAKSREESGITIVEERNQIIEIIELIAETARIKPIDLMESVYIIYRSKEGIDEETAQAEL